MKTVGNSASVSKEDLLVRPQNGRPIQPPLEILSRRTEDKEKRVIIAIMSHDNATAAATLLLLLRFVWRPLLL